MNRPLRLTECSHPISQVFRVYFVGVRNVLAIRSQRYGNPSAAVGDRFIVPTYTYSPCIGNLFETHSRNVRNVLVICMLHIRYAKRGFLYFKSMVFVVQKPPFYIAKVWFLKCNILNKEHGTTKCGIIYKVYCHRILMLNLVETRCSGIMVWCAFGFLVVANILQSGV